MRPLLTVEDVAKILRVTPEAVRDYAQDGLIRHRKLRDSRRAPLRFCEEDVEEYLARQEVRPVWDRSDDGATTAVRVSRPRGPMGQSGRSAARRRSARAAQTKEVAASTATAGGR